MHPVEIMLAESQERMLLEVDPGDVALIGKIAERYDLPWSDIGEVIAEPVYRVTFHGRVVCDLPIDFLCGEAPLCDWEKEPYSLERPFARPSGSIRDLALRVLSHPEVADKSWVYEQYDHDVQIRTLSIGRDSGLLRLEGETLALSCGCNPRHIHLSPYTGTANTVLENACNLACAGATPLCIVNCLNFASPLHPDIYWQLEQSVLGMGDMARKINTPVVGGNVSLYNESDEMGTQIKPTPSIGMIGKGTRYSIPMPKDGFMLCTPWRDGWRSRRLRARRPDFLRRTGSSGRQYRKPRPNQGSGDGKSGSICHRHLPGRTACSPCHTRDWCRDRT